MQKIKIGTRESKLAVIQANLVAEYIKSSCTELEPELVPMKTTGDRILNKTLDKIGGKGLFVKELDLALRENRSDISVHSLKDVPMEIPSDLPLLGFSRREDVRDVLVLPKDTTNFKEVTSGAHNGKGGNCLSVCTQVDESDLKCVRSLLNPSLPLGCSSARRTIQLKKLFPEMEVKSVRGNVLTRLEKLDRGEYSGLILAAAGLKRLGLEERISCYFSTEELLPAAGQGILAVQGRSGEDYTYLKGFFEEESRLCALAERSFVRSLEGGCSSPIAAFAKLVKEENISSDKIANTNSNSSKGTTENIQVEEAAAPLEMIKLTGLFAEEGSTDYWIDTITGPKEQAELLGQKLAERMKKQKFL